MHLGAQVDVRRSIADPAFDAQVNVAGTVSVLEAARDASAHRVLLASTAAVYGNPRAIPTVEDAPIAPLSPYGTSKAAAEWYMAQYRRLHDMSTLALRMANVYGPRQDPHGEAGVVSIFCGIAAAGGRATVYGDGRQTRDYVYVSDVVEAWLIAAESEVTGELNFSTGEETSVLDVLGELDLEYDLAPARPGEIRRSCLDTILGRPRAARLAGARAARRRPASHARHTSAAGRFAPFVARSPPRPQHTLARIHPAVHAGARIRLGSCSRGASR